MDVAISTGNKNRLGYQSTFEEEKNGLGCQSTFENNKNRLALTHLLFGFDHQVHGTLVHIAALRSGLSTFMR